MKKVFVLCTVIVGITSFAQEKRAIAPKAERTEMQSISSEQKEMLHIKKLTLELGLNESQQKQMSELAKEIRGKRDEFRTEKETRDPKKVLTADEKVAMKSKMLDEKIAYKEKVKKILTPEQFTKWEKMQEERKFKKANILPANAGKMEEKK